MLTPIPPHGKILAFGDSLTAGVGTTKQYSYPSVLAKLTGLTVINAGISGEITENGLKRFPQVLDSTAPDLIILMEGGNDRLQNRPFSSIKANLAAMIELANKRGIPVVLMGIPQKRLFSNSAPFYSELAEQYKLVFDDDLIAGLERSRSLKSDPIHFNEKGYRKLAESVYDLLKDNGAL